MQAVDRFVLVEPTDSTTNPILPAGALVMPHAVHNSELQFLFRLAISRLLFHLVQAHAHSFVASRFVASTNNRRRFQRINGVIPLDATMSNAIFSLIMENLPMGFCRRPVPNILQSQLDNSQLKR